MGLIEKIELALKPVLPFYFTTPEFAEKAPEKYAIINIAEKGANYSEGENRVNEYFASVNVFTERLDFALYEDIKSAMYGQGFGYVGGGNVGDDKIYPYGTHYYLDFCGVIER
ncbi:MAG TPA: hypothetical protein DER68_04070 [Ruminococcaceae bacterium]|nr:hypothetical protein [Oscillospiraceae bacterium]